MGDGAMTIISTRNDTVLVTAELWAQCEHKPRSHST